MPQGLLKPLGEQEVLDLLAYLLSRGNSQDPLYLSAKTLLPKELAP